MSGAIPVELGNLANLERLSLGSNALSGPIPTELGNLANLESLWLNGNELSGPIPTELGNLANLHGALPRRQPVEWARFRSNWATSPTCTELSLGGNLLSGHDSGRTGQPRQPGTIWVPRTSTS